MGEGKLVRDLIPAIIRANGENPSVQKLTRPQYRQALLQKLQEEAGEAADARTRAEILSECADCTEVICAILKEYGFTSQQLREEQVRKRTERGGFEKRYFLHIPNE